MSLSGYHRKRNFESTPEPRGRTQKTKGKLIFVVQKHDARRLHYDFRLELDGVLKSWAVPKGPSMNPDDKRLAVMVEDHPYDYRDFEGNISEGNYGAGNVIVWDNGTYTEIHTDNAREGEKKLREGLEKGHIAFRLDGKKLKGEFALIRLHGKQENAWLLVKKKDEFATDEDILADDKSVISDRTVEMLNAENPKKKKETAKKKTVSKKVKAAEAPVQTQADEDGFIAPMLAEKVKEPFDNPDWIYELKFDGYRTVAVIGDGKVELFSRNKLSFTSRYKDIARELETIKHQAVLDGEVVIEDEKGRSGFQMLQNFQTTGKGTLRYYVFDIMSLDGNDTTGLTLLERKELLKMLLAQYDLENVIYSDHIVGQGKDFFELAVKKLSEGIMAKDGRSPYRPGERSNEWLKVKITQEDEAIIIGITEPNGTRKFFGSILLANYDDNHELRFIGKCGTGFNQEILKDLYTQFKPLFRQTSPLNEKIKVLGKVQWIEPKFIAQVKYTELTQDGHLRHPVFLGLRVDLEAGQVKQAANVEIPGTDESDVSDVKPAKLNKMEQNYDLKMGKTILHLTHQNKIYFPDDGITKGDVINYYNEVAEIMLPYLKDRPQNMNRFPNGINGISFYNKDVDVEKIPSWLQTRKIFSESNDDYIDYLLCNDRQTLLYMANLGCIEINPWNSRVQSIQRPDWVVMDLDPSKKDDFREVVRTALMVKEVLDEIGAPCYCKTSGATGLHVYIPLSAKYDYDTVKLFAQLIAQKVNERLPDTTSIVRSVEKRENKIYIDYLQNRFGQTLAAPYSVRPKPGATVSTPLEWSELNEKLSPSMFTIRNMLKRLETKGDLWKPVIGEGINIEAIIEKLSENGNA